jgi:hypothetical protein
MNVVLGSGSMMLGCFFDMGFASCESVAAKQSQSWARGLGN